MYRISTVRYTIKNQSHWLRTLGVSLLVLTAVPAFAVSEEDLAPGPPANASASSLPAPRDVVTSSNTTVHPAPTRTPRGPALPAQRQPAGALSGRIIYTSGGHGFHAAGSVWDSDRPTYQRVSEDLGNQDQMTLFVYQAFNAGATIVPMRPVGNQTNEVIIDNDDPQVTLTGTWTDSIGTPYYGSASDSVNYIFSAASASETATARYSPSIPARGYYPVYSWVLDSNNRNIDQLYRIGHADGVSEVRVNHRRVGKGWVYLGSYYFEAGTGGYCEISNQSSSPAGSNAIADAIRFGNGMGDINRGGGISGLPREEEGSRYWVQAMMGTGEGRDSTVYDRSGLTDGEDNVGAPLRMAAFMNNENQGNMTDRVFLSFHSNGGGGRGADGLWNNEAALSSSYDGTKTPNQLQLATLLGREVNLDMAAIGSPPLDNAWVNRTNHEFYRTDYAFGEIRWDTVNHEMDATIIEVAYHDSSLDAPMLRNSQARTWIARSCVQALVRYFDTYGNGSLAFSPEPPTHIKSVANADGTVTVSWQKPVETTYGGHQPTGYVVYSSTNGYGFGNPQIVSGADTTQLVVSNVAPHQPVYFRVASTNAGGESLPSEVVAVRTAGTHTNSIVIVNGFDRLDTAMSPTETNIGLTEFERAKPWRSNSYDYVVQHAKALHAANRYFDSSSNEAVNLAMLSAYSSAFWILGEESTADDTFDANEQLIVSSYLALGKNLFISGAEIGWDLDYQNNGRNFFQDTLGNNYVNDDAGTYAIASGSGIFSGLGTLAFGPVAPKNHSEFPPANYAPYDADYPDVLAPFDSDGAAILTYSGGGAAAIQLVRGDSKIITLGFPFDCITNETRRATLLTAVADDFDPPVSRVPDWNIY